MHRTIGFALLVGLLSVGGCFMNHDDQDPPDFEVDVVIASVSLAEDCGASRYAAGACAEPEPAPGDADFAPCEDGGDCGCGGGYCQQSGVNLAITADGDRALTFEVLRATLITSDGRRIMELTTDNAQIYDATSGFAAWDEQIPTPSELSVRYDLRGIDWSGVTDPYSQTYRVVLEVSIDGHPRTLTSEETSREYPVVT